MRVFVDDDDDAAAVGGDDEGGGARSAVGAVALCVVRTVRVITVSLFRNGQLKVCPRLTRPASIGAPLRKIVGEIVTAIAMLRCLRK